MISVSRPPLTSSPIAGRTCEHCDCAPATFVGDFDLCETCKADHYQTCPGCGDLYPIEEKDEGRRMKDESDPSSLTHPSSFIPHPSEEECLRCLRLVSQERLFRALQDLWTTETSDTDFWPAWTDRVAYAPNPRSFAEELVAAAREHFTPEGGPR